MIKDLALIFAMMAIIAVGEAAYVVTSPVVISSDKQNEKITGIWVPEEQQPLIHYTVYERDFALYRSYNSLFAMGDEVLRALSLSVKIATTLPDYESICKNEGISNITECRYILPSGAFGSGILPKETAYHHYFLENMGPFPTVTLSGQEELRQGDIGNILIVSWLSLFSFSSLDSLNYHNGQIELCVNKTYDRESETGYVCKESVTLTKEQRRAEFAAFLRESNSMASELYRIIEPESQPHQGIVFFSYSPYYKAIMVAVNIGEAEFSSASFQIDGVKYDGDKAYPLIFAENITLAEGKHIIEVIAGSKQYNASAVINPRHIMILDHGFDNLRGYRMMVVGLERTGVWLRNIELDINGTKCSFASSQTDNQGREGLKLEFARSIPINLTCERRIKSYDILPATGKIEYSLAEGKVLVSEYEATIKR